MYIRNRIMSQTTLLLRFCAWVSLASFASTSSLVTPPKSAVVIAFEYEYELSLFANTLSDEGISTILIVPTSSSGSSLYEPLTEVEVIRLNVDETSSTAGSKESRAIRACESLLTNEIVSKAVDELSPTYLITPGPRHDACLLPWARKLRSIPVIWVLGSEAESYTYHHSGIAMPIVSGGFWSRFSSLLSLRSTLAFIQGNYVNPVSELVGKYLPSEVDTMENFYADVDLIFWGADPILRNDVSAVSQLFVEIGCHHCRGAYPLPPILQKELVEFRSGTIAVLLDEDHKDLIKEIARGLPQGRQGQAVAWKTRNVPYPGEERPENLFTSNEVIRQDIVGYPRTRLALSHCDDTELLEAAFHGTPVICFPRNADEARNAERVTTLGIGMEASVHQESSSVLAMIKIIHETARYRENARKVSVAIRDRPNPATDRITYWLGYVARNKNDVKYLAARENRRVSYRSLYSVDLWLGLGFIVGLISGAVLPAAYILAGRILARNNYRYGDQTAGKAKRKYKS